MMFCKRYFIILYVISCLSEFVSAENTCRNDVEYTISNGHFPRNSIVYSDKRLVIEGLPSKFLIKLRDGFHIEYASTFKNGKYVSYVFGERIVKGKYLDDKTGDGYYIINGPEGEFETKMVLVKPLYNDKKELVFDNSNFLMGENISPSDNPIIEIKHYPESQLTIQRKEIISKFTTGLSNLCSTDCPIHVKSASGKVFCISTYCEKDDDGIKRFKGYILSISEEFGLKNQKIRLLKFEEMDLERCCSPMLLFDDRTNLLYIVLNNQILISEDLGDSFSESQRIYIDTSTISIDPDCYITVESSVGNGIILKNGTLCFPMNVLHRYKESDSLHSAKEVKYAQCFIMYSTNRGNRWKQSPFTPKEVLAWEFAIVEYNPNKIMINARGGTEENWKRTTNGRRVFTSSTKGKMSNWEITGWNQCTHLDGKMWDPICSASMITFDHKKNRIALFSNPYIPDRYMPRTNIIVQASTDYMHWTKIANITGPYEITQGYTNIDFCNGRATIVYCDYLSSRIMFSDFSLQLNDFLNNNIK